MYTLFRDENLGCGRAVSEAITWFFDSVEAGIILEDDCLPDPSFFSFAAELLDRYKEDERVMMINGASYLDEGEASYYFSKFDQVWGWASWRRAWQKYDFELKNWPRDEKIRTRLKELRPLTRWYVSRVWNRIQAGEVDTWDYQWEYAIWREGGLTITPLGNLISNIGFDERATHTFTGDDGRANRSLQRMSFPLTHPQKVESDVVRDRWYELSKVVSFGLLFRRVINRIRS